MKIEILLATLVFSFSQASFDVNRTVNPLNHPENEKVPINPNDPVRPYNLEHSSMMFFTALQHYFTDVKANEDFLSCMEEKIDLYTQFSHKFTQNLTDVARSIKNSEIGKNKQKSRAANALINIGTLAKEFGKNIELSAVEENSDLAKSHIQQYKIKIKKCEHVLLKVLNKIAKTNLKEIQKIDGRIKEINLQTQKDANHFIREILQCMKNRI